MKRPLILVFLILACVAVTASAFAQTTPPVEPKPPEGLDYSYFYTRNIFKAGESIAFIDNYMFDLKVTAREAGAEDVYVSLFDLKRLYAPDFAVTEDGTTFAVKHVGITVTAAIDDTTIDVSGVPVSLTQAPTVIDGEICVPVASFMSTAFAKDTAVSGDFVIVGHNQDELSPLGRGGPGLLRLALRGKKNGFIYRAYWFEEGNRTMSYRMYVPTTYDPEIPNKMILLAHGASRSQDFWFTDTNTRIQNTTPIEIFAEKYGYILAAPNSYIKRGGYGDPLNIPLMTQSTTRELSDAQMELRVLSGKGFMLGLDDVLRNYNIDENNIFLMGQSMGALGALSLGDRYSDTFKAVVCSALMPNLGILDGNPYPNLVDKPVLFIEGTEDQYGFDLAQQNSAILASYLNNYSTYWAGGAGHSVAWARSLEQIFDFLNEQ
jgi:predicted esterase